MKLGCGLPMGPLALMDLIGLDTAYEILDTMYRRGGRDRRHAPAPLLKQMVTAGLLGRKSGRGFYTYEKPGSPVVVDDELTPAASARRRPPAPTIRKVGVIGSGTMADRHHRGVREGRLRGHLGDPGRRALGEAAASRSRRR